MTSRNISPLLAAAAVSLGVACAVLLAGAGSALACVVGPNDDGCHRPNYHVQRTDGSLAQWSGPGSGRIVGWLGGNGTSVDVVCETTGSTEDGLPYIVWDRLDDGTYVYGYYLDTPGDGYHPALTACPGSGGGMSPSPAPGAPPSPPGGGKTLPPNSYNAAGAAAWARANATANSDPYGYRDDCTDFVSRAMQIGGGTPNIDVQGVFPFNHTDDLNWYAYWAGRWIETYSWGSAPHLAKFLKNTGWARQVSVQDARPGDLIFVHWGSGYPDGIDHVGMIVGNPGRGGEYNVQIAQHTSNRIEPLSDWKRAGRAGFQYWIYSIYYH